MVRSMEAMWIRDLGSSRGKSLFSRWCEMFDIDKTGAVNNKVHKDILYGDLTDSQPLLFRAELFDPYLCKSGIQQCIPVQVLNIQIPQLDPPEE